MEKDDEISGNGNSYTAEFWQYDPRLGRRWNVDPVILPSESPYAAFRNNPILLNDPEGDCSDCPKPTGQGKEGEIRVTNFVGDTKEENGTQNWAYHAGSEGQEAGWLKIEEYGKMIFNYGKGEGGKEAGSYGKYESQMPDFFKDGREVSIDALGWADVFLDGVDAGKSQYNFYRSGTINTTSLEFDVALLVYSFGSSSFIRTSSSKATQEIASELPMQIHHFATNKHSFFTPQMEAITSKFGLSLNGAWNKQLMPHLGRHPHAYHRFVLKAMQDASVKSMGNQATFLKYFDQNVIQQVVNNPQLLRKAGWQ
jgi:hypothetical protein